VPTKIYVDDDSKDEVAWFCGEDWDLAAQVLALEAWLSANQSQVPAGGCIADIGFSVHLSPGGGGAAISPTMMRCMADLGITLFLSEYPASDAQPDR
jgi:hypothetical protein